MTERCWVEECEVWARENGIPVHVVREEESPYVVMGPVSVHKEGEKYLCVRSVVLLGSGGDPDVPDLAEEGVYDSWKAALQAQSAALAEEARQNQLAAEQELAFQQACEGRGELNTYASEEVRALRAELDTYKDLANLFASPFADLSAYVDRVIPPPYRRTVALLMRMAYLRGKAEAAEKNAVPMVVLSPGKK